MRTPFLGGPYITPLGRLLGGWRDMLDDIRQLCTGLNALPDRCACGDARSHLNGSCHCCNTVQRERIAECADCQTMLVKLRGEIDILAVDTIRFFPIVRMLLSAPQREPARAGGDAIEPRIAAVRGTFDRLVAAVDEFRIGCRASHLQVIKQTTAELLGDANRLDQWLKDLP